MNDALDDLFFKTHKKDATNILACPLMNYLPKNGEKQFEIN